MKNRLCRLLWFGALALLMIVAVAPLSNRLTRAGGLGLSFVVWFGLVALAWQRRPVRFVLLAITICCAGFLALPARGLPDSASIRSNYLEGLRRYDAVTYFWGGESRTGIDCSGLVRRGMVDSLFLQGVRHFDAGLVRRAISFWWNDCTAAALGEGRDGLTMQVAETKSINSLDHSRILPGDLAVTSNGVHVMAYLGDKRWIEADPEAGRVIIVSVPAARNAWFEARMRIVRWSILN